MKNITLQQLERDFDRILDDVVENGEHYNIVTVSFDESGKLVDNHVVLIPYKEYSVLTETYNEWISEDSYEMEKQFAPADENYDDPLS